MKILSISLKNLASFAREVTLDFRTPPLMHAGVFAIIGPTGSGKSTLLDALCLALYGCTPRSNESNALKLHVEGEKEAWTAQDSRQLVRRGVSEAFAKVVFEANDLAYEATWRCHRGTRGKSPLAVECTLRLENEIIRSGITDVAKEVKTLTGLDFEGFCRSVLLPQGRFEKFLTSRPAERSALLETLTDPMGLYRGVSKLAHERGSAWAARISEAKTRVDAVAVLSDEARAELDARLSALDEEFAQVDATTQVIGSELARLDAVVAAHAQLENRKNELEQRATACRAADPERRQLADARAAAGLRETGRRRDEAAKRAAEFERGCAELEQKLAEARGIEHSASAERVAAESASAAAVARYEALRPHLDRARALDADLARNAEGRSKNQVVLAEAEKALRASDQAIAEHEARQRKVEARIHEVDAWMTAHPDAAMLVERKGAWSTALEDFAAGQDKVVQARETMALLSAQAAKCAEEVRLASAKHAEDEQLAEAARVAKIAATEHAAALRATNVSERREAADQRLKRAEGLIAQLSQRSDERRELARLMAESVGSDADRARLVTERAERAEEVARLGQAVQQANRDYALAQARASMAQHRTALVEGEPCSVCGSTTHPWADPRAIPAQDASNRAELEVALRNANDALRVSEAELAVASDRAARAADSAKQLEARLVQSRPLLEEACSALGLSTAVDEDGHLAMTASLRDALSEELKVLVAAGKAADEAASEERAAQERVIDCTRAVTESSKRAERARSDLESAMTQLGALEQSVSEREAAVTTSERRATEALSDIPGAVEAFRADPRGQLARWLGLTNECETRLQGRSRDADEAQALAKGLEPLTRARVEAETKRAMHRDDEAKLHAELAELSLARSAVLEGRAVDEVETEAQGALNAHARAVQAAMARVHSALQSLASLQGQRENAERALARGREDAAASLTEHHALLTSLGLDEAEAARRLSLSEEQLGALETRLNALDAAALAAAKLVQEAEEALAVAVAQQPARSREAVNAELEVLEQRRKALNDEQAGCRFTLSHDLTQRGERREREAEFDALVAEGGVWGALASLIGSHDGSSFALYAQSLAFDSLLASANEQLARLHPRYTLRRLEDTAEESLSKRLKQALLEMVIEDRELGDIIRPVSTLSGGERFLVSLALALGLSSLASQRRKLASMFIDEGFGTLDPEFLGTVVSVLDALHARGTRVGVISHVSELKDRLQAQVVVERRGDGTSTLRIVG